MRPETTTNSAPASSCHPVKTKTPSLSADHTLHKPNKLLSVYPPCYDGLVHDHTHAHKHTRVSRPCAHSQLLPKPASSQCLRSPTPHLDRSSNTVTGCSCKAPAEKSRCKKSPSKTLNVSGFYFFSITSLVTGSCMQKKKHKKLKCGNGFLCCACILKTIATKPRKCSTL